MANMQKITPNLWFSNEAEEAVNFYISLFPDSKIIKTLRYGSEGQEIHKMPEGSVMTIEFELQGLRYVALNGGPVFTFNEAVSFIINCKDQEEVDRYWNALTEGGDESAQVCGWLKDKYGLSWQVVPEVLEVLFSSDNKTGSERAMKAMLQMKKLDVEKLQQAFDGK